MVQRHGQLHQVIGRHAVVLGLRPGRCQLGAVRQPGGLGLACRARGVNNHHKVVRSRQRTRRLLRGAFCWRQQVGEIHAVAGLRLAHINAVLQCRETLPAFRKELHIVKPGKLPGRHDSLDPAVVEHVVDLVVTVADTHTDHDSANFCRGKVGVNPLDLVQQDDAYAIALAQPQGLELQRQIAGHSINLLPAVFFLAADISGLLVCFSSQCECSTHGAW